MFLARSVVAAGLVTVVWSTGAGLAVLAVLAVGMGVSLVESVPRRGGPRTRSPSDHQRW